jgi:AbrB family looped-hinge helix DNA binding protein
MKEQEKTPGCCRMEAVVTLDSRGQIVLPKDLREKAGLEKGDKLMVVSCEDEGKVCCITLMKADDSNEMVRNMLGPMLKGVFGGD